MSHAKIDLRQLAVRREEPAVVSVPAKPRRRHLMSRYVLPGCLLAGFIALVVYAVGDTLSPPRPVTVVPVLIAQSDLPTMPDAPLFQAAGRVEPRPTPTLVTALTEGVVEELLVVEGQEVVAGAIVARLVAADAQLEVDRAKAELRLREAEVEGSQATLEAATARREQPVHLRADWAEAEVLLARSETELANLPNLIRAAEARRKTAQADLENKRRSAGAIPAIVLSTAESDLEAAAASVAELQTRQKRLPVEVEALRARRDALRLRLERKTEEIRQEAEARAALRGMRARLEQARTALDGAKLRLERTLVRAPVGGRVLALAARPGMRLTGLSPGSLHDSSTVVTLYDPKRLQVRVDVRLDDIGKVQPGQRVRIDSTAVASGPLTGEVLFATSQADIQKNTLAVKVAIEQPPATLKPDMLCQVTFLASPRTKPEAGDDSPLVRLLVPRQLVEAAVEGSQVWVADRATGRARRASVQVGASHGELVEVVSGLASWDKLIVGNRDGLRDGQRVIVTGEDETLGTARAAK